MPVIRISAQALERLKEWAEPLTDTAESALVKVLDAADHESSPAADRGAPTPDPRATRPRSGNRLRAGAKTNADFGVIKSGDR